MRNVTSGGSRFSAVAPARSALRRRLVGRGSVALASMVVGSMMLDSKGSILACTENVARLCGLDAHDMTDHPVKSFIPEIPIDPDTEGYNVAFVAFMASTSRIESVSVRSPRGNTTRVEARFTLLKIEARYLFRIQLRWTEKVGTPASPRIRVRSTAAESHAVAQTRRRRHDPLHH